MDGYATVVTGGAGFIGSHLVERLLKEGFKVTILDNLSSGKMKNIQHLKHNPSLTVIKEDLKQPKQLRQVIEKCDLIFHLAANPEVRIGETEPNVHFQENILTTFNLLETMRQAKTQKMLIFTSTSTVYGEASQIPTPEDYAPLLPISTYGASKLACEALITSYAHTFNHRALILRLANIVGRRSNHGVIADFVNKIRANQKELEILGDGTQEKSYLHVRDCVDAAVHLTKVFLANSEKVDIYNIGSIDKITVKEIARIVAKEMKQPKIKYRFAHKAEGGRGWKGDIKFMQLSIEKLVQTGWKPRHTSRQAVMLAAKELVKEHL
jgi:UDP-glucose 4-epimerase